MLNVSARQMVITFVPALVILGAMVVVSIEFHVNMRAMTGDVASLARIHPLSGILSSLGILLWCSSAAICFFVATTFRHLMPRDSFLFLLFSAILSTYLLLDDLFQFHEALAPRYLGIQQRAVIVALGIAVLSYLVAFRRVIWRTNLVALILALGFLTISAAIDQILEHWLSQLGHWIFLFEDGAKWLGIASWCSYYVHTCNRLALSRQGLLPITAKKSD